MSSDPAVPVTIPLAIPNVGPSEQAMVDECLASGWVSTAGPYVRRFEERFARAIGVDDAVSVVNGTSAIQLALRVLGVGAGDTVIVPDLTFIATANPVLHAGAEPVLLDVDERSLALDPQRLDEALKALRRDGRAAKAVIVVHLYGRCAPVQELLSICREHGAALIEDAAESLGSRLADRSTGTVGDVGCFSFNGNKILTTGGGGMLVARDAALLRRARHLSTQARTDPVEFDHDEAGYNWRLPSTAAALGIAQLDRLEEFVRAKRRVQEFYRDALADVPGLKVLDEQAPGNCNFWMPVVLVDAERFGCDSKALIRRLGQAGIQARPLFKPLHLLAMFDAFGQYPVSTRLWETGLNLPCSTNVTDRQLETVVEAIRQISRERETCGR